MLVRTRLPSGTPSQIGRGVPLTLMLPSRVRRHRVEVAVLLADAGHAVDLHRTGADGLGVVVPVAVRRHDREVLLARVLDGILRHAGVDAVGLAGIVPADPRQALASRRGATGLLREQLVEPERCAGSNRSRRCAGTCPGLIGALSESAESGTLFGYFGLTVIRPTRKLSVSGVKARLAALLIMAIRVR